MHTRDYSDETSRVIDEEVERILREQEQRAVEYLTRHRRGLDAVAASLLEKETIDGAEVGRLVDAAFGRPVHGDGAGAGVPHFGTTEATDAGPPDGEAPEDAVTGRTSSALDDTAVLEPTQVPEGRHWPGP
jgi:hypothetical protein